MNKIFSPFKKLTVAILTSITLAIAPAHAGLQPDVTLVGGTNNVAAVSANTYHTGSFAVVNASQVTFQLYYDMSAAGAAAVNFTIDTSVDNAHWQNNAMIFATSASGAVTSNTFVLSTNVGAIPFVRHGWVTNASASNFATNVTLKVFTKPGI